MLAHRRQQRILGERLGQVFIGPHHAAACPVEQAVLGRLHDDGRGAVLGIALDQRAGLVAVELWHHDVDEHHVRLVVGDLGQRVETVLRQDDFAARLVQEDFCATAYGVAVFDDHHLDAYQCFIVHTFLQQGHRGNGTCHPPCVVNITAPVRASLVHAHRGSGGQQNGRCNATPLFPAWNQYVTAARLPHWTSSQPRPPRSWFREWYWAGRKSA